MLTGVGDVTSREAGKVRPGQRAWRSTSSCSCASPGYDPGGAGQMRRLGRHAI
ncbi:hypothetical protein RB213_015162 [Colletotrichum asianum]